MFRYAELLESNGSLVLRSAYHPGLVAALKATIPANARRYDPVTRTWIVAPSYGQQVAKIVQDTIGVQVAVPTMTGHTQPETKIIRLEYLGQAKDRGDGNLTAYGFDGSEWGFLFPLLVLKTWFGETSKPDEAPTLYGILGTQTAATDDDVRSAYRRAARQWHPDVCSEPDATQQFQRIQAAYEILHDPLRRARYDAGLQLAGSINRNDRHQAEMYGASWKPPLRCGLLLVECTAQVGRFVVSRILQWADIVAPDGSVLVTSWPAGAKEPIKRWI